ncbi:lactonase family protein [Aquisphaera insulae]|uniref:lactonase family protein n=1 Tax=Aquisphaera insulae TaxID=2712864 RepID=UPI0013EB66A6|nr:lactonase family protein [Aquisphaera insulae]
MPVSSANRRPVWSIGSFTWAFAIAIATNAAGPSAGAAEGSGATARDDAKGTYWVYVGTYTGGKTPSEGIYLLELDPASGKVTEYGPVAKLASPSFLAIRPGGKELYAVSEVGRFQGKPGGGVTAMAIHPVTGKLTKLNEQSSVGSGPCHLTVDRTGKNVLVANYNNGVVACLPIAENGHLKPASCSIQHEGSSVDKGRQEGPHAHSINVDPMNRFALAADLGLDKVMVYRLDAEKGLLTPNDPAFGAVPPGSGPRHLAFHPSGRFAYVISEMGNTLTAFAYDADKGSLTQIQSVSTLPADFRGTSYTADVHVHPSGKFVYGSNRGHDSIAIFAVDESTGKLTAAGHASTGGKTPRNFAIDPTGSCLLAENQDSDTIVVFRIDGSTGGLSRVGAPIKVPMPVCIQMIPRATQPPE